MTEKKMCETMRQIIVEENAKAVAKAVMELYIQLFTEGVLTDEEATEKTGMAEEAFLKKKKNMSTPRNKRKNQLLYKKENKLTAEKKKRRKSLLVYKRHGFMLFGVLGSVVVW